MNDYDAIEYLLESEDAKTREAAKVMGAKINAQENALREIKEKLEGMRPQTILGRFLISIANKALNS